MRRILQICLVVALGACEVSGPLRSSVAQDIAGPGGVTVAPPTIDGVAIAGELLVAWTPDQSASKYYVFQSASGAPYGLVASVVGAPPAATLTVGGLSAGAYCYAVESEYPDGSTSDPGAPGCGDAIGTGGGSFGGDHVATTNILALIGPTFGPSWTTGIGAANEAFAISNTESTIVAQLPLVVGDRIKSLSFNLWGNGSANLSATVFYVSSSMSGTPIGATASTAPAASWSTVIIDVDDTTVAVLDEVDVRFVASGPGVRLGNISYTYDHLQQ